MKVSNVFVLISGLVSLIANVLGVLSYLSPEGPFADWQLDQGLVVVLAFVLMAYGLAIWSALALRWTRGRGERLKRGSRRIATFLLNWLVAFPLLILWLNLLFSAILFTGASSTERWFLALGFAWGITPFTALGLMALGEIMEPLLITAE